VSRAHTAVEGGETDDLSGEMRAARLRRSTAAAGAGRMTTHARILRMGQLCRPEPAIADEVCYRSLWFVAIVSLEM
jgi:hypothetical protein